MRRKCDCYDCNEFFTPNKIQLQSIESGNNAYCSVRCRKRQVSHNQKAATRTHIMGAYPNGHDEIIEELKNPRSPLRHENWAGALCS